jgi:hypothetical protein
LRADRVELEGRPGENCTGADVTPEADVGQVSRPRERILPMPSPGRDENVEVAEMTCPAAYVRQEDDMAIGEGTDPQRELIPPTRWKPGHGV